MPEPEWIWQVIWWYPGEDAQHETVEDYEDMKTRVIKAVDGGYRVEVQRWCTACGTFAERGKERHTRVCQFAPAEEDTIR